MTISVKANPQFEGYAYLESVLDAALHQAAAGKGKERHACDRPFDQQPMQLISDLLQSTDGMAYQAIKKIQEAARMDYEPAIRELLGSINYTAGIIIKLMRDHEKEQVFDRLQPVKDGLTYLVGPDGLKCELHSTDTVPMKQYNELLDRYTELHKRVCEAD